MLKKLIYSLVLFLCVHPLFAQQELGLHFMNNIWQANKTNPSFITPNKVHYALPSLYYNIAHTGAAYNDVVVTNSQGENVLDVGAILDGLADNNQLFTNIELETTSFSFGIKNIRFSINHAFKLNAYLDYPKDLIELGWNGNSQFIGETIQIGPDFQAYAYSEYGIGAAMKILGVSAGARLKILTGIGDVSTERTKASVYTDPDVYQLTLDTDYKINTASFLSYGGGTDFEIDFGEFSADDLLSSNLGMAIDLGANFKIKNVEVSASIIDLGFINWKKNATNLHSLGSYKYEGLDFSNIIHDDEIDFEGTLDTLGEIFDFQETNNAYKTMLPTKMYLSGSIHVGKMWDFGGLFYSEMYRGNFFPAFAASARASLGKIASVGAVYSIRNQTFDNVGLNATIKLGPVQIFGVTDNILAAFQPYDSQNVNTRFGINLLFK